MNGLLGNPLFMAGMGMLANNGPSLRPVNKWRGAMQGLLASSQVRAQQERMELERAEMEQMRQIREAQIRQMLAQQEQWKQGHELDVARFDYEKTKPRERERAQDINGVWRFVDTGDPVFGVEKAPETLSPYQDQSLDLERQRLAETQKQNELKQAEEGRARREEKIKVADGLRANIATTRRAISVAKEAAEFAKNNWTASGVGGVVGNYPGSAKRTLQGYITELQSAIGLQELLRIKAQGGTFGSLSEKEMDLLISNLGDLSPDQSQDVLVAKLTRVQALLAGQSIKAQERLNQLMPSDLFQQADTIIGITR